MITNKCHASSSALAGLALAGLALAGLALPGTIESC